MRIFLVFLIGSALSLGCVDDISDTGDDFTICEGSPDYFDPKNKTFIPPAKSDFIDTICTPLELSGNVTYFDLNADKTCLLEQHLAQMADSLTAESCQDVISVQDLDAYYYQYVSLNMGGSNYIFVNAFQDFNLDSTDWKTEPYIGSCNNGINQFHVLFNLDELRFEQFRTQLERNTFYIPGAFAPNVCGRCVPENMETFRLKRTEVCLLESSMDKLRDVVSQGCYFSGDKIDFGYDYYMNYMGVQKNGYRGIYVDGLLKYPEDEFREPSGEFFPPIGICDAGSGAWGVLFNLETHEFEDLQFNHSR